MRLFEPKGRIVVTIGYQGHGKTVFLASLFWDSLFTLSAAFHDEQQTYSVHAINEEASKVFYGNAITLSKLELPMSNPRNEEPKPAVLEFRGVPCANHQWWRNPRQNITLTFYDMSGELAKSDELLRDKAPFLRKADDIIFLFDPTREDFKESVAQAAVLRDRIYRVAPRSKRKHFIVALSKIDEYTDGSHVQTEWGTEITNRNWLDFTSSLENLPDYLSKMDERSHPDVLRRWWTKEADDAAYGFLDGLPRNKHYCAISSLGHQPIWDCPNCKATEQPDTLQRCGVCDGERTNVKLRLRRKPEPIRVRDPLFWIFLEAGVM